MILSAHSLRSGVLAFHGRETAFIAPTRVYQMSLAVQGEFAVTLRRQPAREHHLWTGRRGRAARVPTCFAQPSARLGLQQVARWVPFRIFSLCATAA